MGESTPEGGPFGDDCATCWAAGATPKFITLQVTGLVTCPRATVDAPSGFFTLQQDAVVPCRWQYEDDDYRIRLDLLGGSSRVIIQYAPDTYYRYFYNNPMVSCVDNYANDYSDCIPVDRFAYDGSVIITAGL